jgi:hypothetical protein
VKLAAIARQFDVAGRLVKVEPTGDGNVNDTYLVVFRTTFSEERFILQRINRKVFPRPDFIIENMCVLTDHVHPRLEDEADSSDRIWQLPRIIQAKDGKNFVIDEVGDYWRGISLIASAQSFSRVQSLEHAYEAGLVLGQFQRIVSDLSVDKLHDTLVGFHITPGYLSNLDAALATPQGQERLRSSLEAERCYRFVTERREWAGILEDAKDCGKLSQRTIHGDPKISNIMIDTDTGKGTSIVDLDTVKPGLIHYDVGDALRSCCNPAGEDAKDLSQVFFDTDLCDTIVKGYMLNAKEFLTDEDRALLYDGVRLIAFELGLRFFADFIAGDVYFKTSYEGHNLNRARVQFKLTESIETRESIIRKTLERV